VLSNQAIPNQLSTMPGSARPTVEPAEHGTPVHRRVAAQSGQAPPQQAPRDEAAAPGPVRRGIRLPSLGTIIFVGFIALTLSRFVGQALPDIGPTPRPTSAPQGVATPPASEPVAPGTVWFGQSVTDDCRLAGRASIFTGPVRVWWRAQLSTVLGASDGVLVLTFRDGEQIDRDAMAPDPGASASDIVCADHFVPDSRAGTFKVEVWRTDRSERLAIGVFLRR